MARRSLPERTVDAWVAASICDRFPTAQIWGPTQNAATNWDAGVGMAGKALILEDKATTPYSRIRKVPRDFHRIEIDRDQLDWYCDDVEPNQVVPVYYVLPNPPWHGEPTGWDVLPHQAATRDTFEEWAWVMRCHDLRAWLGTKSGMETHRLPSSPAITLEVFLDGIDECRFGRRLTKAPSAADLKQEVARLQVGQVPDRPRARSDARLRKLIGSSLCAFIPAAELTPRGWFET